MLFLLYWLMKEDHFWMQKALEQAKLAEQEDEVPVGAIILYKSQIIGQGFNQPRKTKLVYAHAEIIALEQACRTLNNYRLPGCTMYVTLEPCAMCAGALVHARIQRLVIGAVDQKTGACGSVINILNNEKLNHQVEVSSGILAQESASLLRNFFKDRR